MNFFILVDNFEQSSLSSSFLSAGITKNNVSYDLAVAFTSADIPINKLNHAALKNFLAKYFMPSIPLPSVSSARNQILVIQQELFQKIKKQLSNKKVAILADESTDDHQRLVLQILLVELDAFKACKPYLAETNFLNETNHASVSQSVVKCLTKFEIEFDNVMAYGTDNVKYMIKSYQTLKNIYGNSRHVTCFAHIIALIGDCYRIGFPEVDKLVASIKFIFCKAGQRRRRYFLHLQSELSKNSSELKAILPPSPVIIRWNTWFSAVKYLADYWEYLKSFVLTEIVENGETEKLKEINLLMNSSIQEEDKLSIQPSIQDEVNFIAKDCAPLCHLQVQFQYNSLNTTLVYNTINDLLTRIEFTISENLNKNKICDALKAAKEKVTKYFDEGGQPAMSFFAAIRIFDPYQVAVMDPDISVYLSDIPELKDVGSDWAVYLGILFY